MANAGLRDRLITFQRDEGATDAFGGITSDWRYLRQEWASKTDISDGEKWRASEISSQVTTRFVVLSNDGTRAITPRDRITLDGDIYEIFGIKEIGRRVELEITAGRKSD